ncbi:MAG: dTDP-4-dehydrorhamnose reductase [candidate division Zixibacteria bacterium]|nr:dTDP-4-dehydrorhamnose reductase [candidate division Zixibacteria bacterium]
MRTTIDDNTAAGSGMKVLVTGHLGILGRALMVELVQRKVDAVGVDVAQMDVTDAGRVRAVVTRERPTAVVNCAAFTGVDDCESHKGLCFAVNAQGAENVAAAAADADARVIQLSTDYVFDGTSRVPYAEDAKPAPLSAYGESKLEGERRVAAVTSDHLVVRTAWLFGVGGVNFVSKVLTRAKAGEPLAVVDDERGSPTYAGHLATALAELLDVEFRGVVHVAGAGDASWYDVAAEVLRLTGMRARLEAIAAADLDLAARRPPYSALDISRYTALTGQIMPSWREGLAAYLREIKEVSDDAR